MEMRDCERGALSPDAVSRSSRALPSRGSPSVETPPPSSAGVDTDGRVPIRADDDPEPAATLRATGVSLPGAGRTGTGCATTVLEGRPGNPLSSSPSPQPARLRTDPSPRGCGETSGTGDAGLSAGARRRAPRVKASSSSSSSSSPLPPFPIASRTARARETRARVASSTSSASSTGEWRGGPGALIPPDRGIVVVVGVRRGVGSARAADCAPARLTPAAALAARPSRSCSRSMVDARS
jgi:hypothetical protein